MKTLPLEAFPGYLVSDEGEIYSEFMGGKCPIRRIAPLRMTGWVDPDGYKHVNLTRYGKRKRFAVHVLVALAYCGERPSPAHEVCHGDGSKDNNHPSNLRWGTRQENADDKIAHGKSCRGIVNAKSKITPEIVRTIRQMVDSGLSKCEVARRTGISNPQVGKIARRQPGGWDWLPDDDEVIAA